MKKKLLLTGILACMLVAFAACGTGNDSTENSSSTDLGSSVESSVTSENTQSSETASSEENAHEHAYTLVAQKAGTCNEKGAAAHYLCEECGKKFDLLENEIDSVEGDYDYTNHAGEATLVATAQPTQLTYKVGEVFNPTGMVVVYKCENCDGEVIDNQFLTYAYQTEAGAFAADDTKVTVCYNQLSFELALSVEKAGVEISGVEESYETTCLTAPEIKATANVVGAELVIEYFNAEEEQVTEEDFVAGETYTVKVSVAGTDAYLGAEVTSVVTVKHNHQWTCDAQDWKKLTYQCLCGEMEDYYALDYQPVYVDEDDLEVDLSNFIVGAENVTIKSVQQIVRMINGYLEAKDGEKKDIEYTNEGMVYVFPTNKFEKASGEWKPYILTLSVVYDVDGVECPLVVEVKFVDKLIETAEDLKELAYTGAASISDGGVAVSTYYALAGDIDATGVVIPESKHAWQEAIGFCGVLEGNGHTISNLTIPAWRNGLFGALGSGSKIQNVKFTNVVLGEGSHLFALVTRKTIFNNVEIEFSVDSGSYTLADTANGNTFNGVKIYAPKGANPFKKVDESAMVAIPEGITMLVQGIMLDFCVRGKSVDHDEYGKVYDMSQQQWFAENDQPKVLGSLNQGALANALPDDADYFYFWIYNGTDTEYTFHLAGNVNGTWTDSADFTTLKVGEWTKVVISAKDIQLNKQGDWYAYILQGDNQGAAKEGWKISAIYAGKTESNER